MQISFISSFLIIIKKLSLCIENVFGENKLLYSFCFRLESFTVLKFEFFYDRMVNLIDIKMIRNVILMIDTIKYGTKEIAYSLTHSPKRKTVNIVVESGKVCVVIPQGVSKKQYEPLIYKKAPWILKQLTDFEEISLNVQELKFQSGEKLPYLGRYYRLKVKKEFVKEVSFIFSQSRFIAIVPLNTNLNDQREKIFPHYKKWIQEKGYRFAQKRIPRFTERLGISPAALSVREMEKRWGSCTPQQKIFLNWRIFLAPVSMVDYVLAHEIAHLKVMSHTPVYWETLRMLIPDYEERKEWLRINGNQLYI